MGRLRKLPDGFGVGAAIALTVIGFGLLAYTWAQVSTLTVVAKQMPYLISGGLTGLGLVVFGAALLVVTTRSRDDEEKTEQAQALVEALREVAAQLEKPASKRR